MSTPGLLVCPVLVGRDDLLALAEQRLTDAVEGNGGMLFLAGEAGIGKTRLLDSIVRRATQSSMQVVRAATFAGDTELAGGVIIDLARDLQRSTDERLRGTGAALSARLLEAPPASGDMHRIRRVLVLDLVDLLFSAVGERPTIFALEDLHWADDLTLEVLAQFARRLPESPIFVLGTYRSDELYPRVPLRLWRSHLLSQRLAGEARLRRLTLDETATMVSAVMGSHSPSPTRWIEAIYQRGDGIPLHVEELLASTRGLSDDPQPRVMPVPETLADMVVLRASTLAESSRAIAAAAAVIGRSFDFDLLAAVADAPIDAVSSSLRELQDRHFMQPNADSVRIDFRHALIRDALYAQIPLSTVRRLHDKVAEEAIRRGLPDSIASAHLEAAGRSAEAFDYALRAARQSAATSSHRESLELFRRAWRNLPLDVSPVERASLLAEMAAEAAATDDNESAADAYEQAHQLFVVAGRAVEAAEVVPPLAAVRHLLGDGLAERVARLEAALRDLECASASDEADRARLESARAGLLAGLSAAYMLDRRLEESIQFGQQARQTAEGANDRECALNVVATLGSVLVFAGRMDEGWELLEHGIRGARSARLEMEATRAYRMIGSCASVLVDYDRAEHWLREGVDYAERVELWNHRHYMAAHLAHVAWATGEWSTAQKIAELTLVDGRGGITTRITALHALGYVALGRGEWDSAVRLLEEAHLLGESMGELQRLSPALWGLAEVALLTGRMADCVSWCDRAYEESVRVKDAAYLFPFTLTGTRARLAMTELSDAQEWLDRVTALLRHRNIPGTLPAIDHAQGIIHLAAGRTRQAREALDHARGEWARLRRHWEGSFVLADLGRCALRSNQPAVAAAWAQQTRERGQMFGSSPLIREAEQILDVLDGKQVADGAAWAPLTPRESEVARLVASGMTNREIADQLVVSPKTVSAHIEHILTKLDASRRAEIATWVSAARKSSDLVD